MTSLPLGTTAACSSSLEHTPCRIPGNIALDDSIDIEPLGAQVDRLVCCVVCDRCSCHGVVGSVRVASRWAHPLNDAKQSLHDDPMQAQVALTFSTMLAYRAPQEPCVSCDHVRSKPNDKQDHVAHEQPDVEVTRTGIRRCHCRHHSPAVVDDVQALGDQIPVGHITKELGAIRVAVIRIGRGEITQPLVVRVKLTLLDVEDELLTIAHVVPHGTISQPVDCLERGDVVGLDEQLQELAH